MKKNRYLKLSIVFVLAGIASSHAELPAKIPRFKTKEEMAAVMQFNNAKYFNACQKSRGRIANYLAIVSASRLTSKEIVSIKRAEPLGNATKNTRDSPDKTSLEQNKQKPN